MQARNQLGTIGAAKSFLRRAQIFKLCPMVLTYAQHVFPGGGEKFCRGVPGYGPEHMFEEQYTEKHFKR